MGSCKQECNSDKVCNAKSARCVLKTGKIGKQLTGAANANANANANRRRKAVAAPRPLTMNEVVRVSEAPRKAMQKLFINDDGNGFVRIPRRIEDVLGGAVPLTGTLIRELLPNPGDTVRLVVAEYDQSSEEREWDSVQNLLKPETYRILTLHRPTSFSELEAVRNITGFDSDFNFDQQNITNALIKKQVLATATRPGGERDTTWLTPTIINLNTNTNNTGLTVRSWSIFFRSGDRTLMTWIARGAKPLRPAPVIVDASKRTASGRKAPAGHAKNYAGKMARGLDGKLWESKQIQVKGKLTWRWKPSG